MSKPLLERLRRLEADYQARSLAPQANHPARCWLALNLYVRSRDGGDITPWREAMAALPPLPRPRPQAQPWDESERTARALALLCRGARISPEYRELLAVAIEAGLATERQVEWIVTEGLVDGFHSLGR